VDLIEEWIRHNGSAAILGTASNCGCLSITDLATYHGFMDFEVVGNYFLIHSTCHPRLNQFYLDFISYY